MEESKRKSIVLYIAIAVLAIFSGWNIINQYEATAVLQCSDNLPDSVFPIDIGEEYIEGTIKLTSYLQNTANIYDPYKITHNYPESDNYEKQSSFSGYVRNKCIIELMSDWRFR